MLLKISMLYCAIKVNSLYIILHFLKILWDFLKIIMQSVKFFHFFLSSLCAFSLLALPQCLQFPVECGNSLAVKWLDCT